MKKLNTIIPALAALGLLANCSDPNTGASEDDQGHAHEEEKGDHAHQEEEHEHEHEEIALGTFDIGGNSVEAAQGHGEVAPGKEGHLVIKLPFNDSGETVVRAWIGTEDRTLSAVGKGEYAPSHDDYDIHAVAPDPLPEGAKWWLEIEKPDGSKAVGSIPLLKDVEED
ncbi:MAG: hypothetical protein WD342_04905 [Verrucomicrobiales bacterium]